MEDSFSGFLSLPPGVAPGAVTWPPPGTHRPKELSGDAGECDPPMLPPLLEDLACAGILSLRSPAFASLEEGGGEEVHAGVQPCQTVGRGGGRWSTVVEAQTELMVRQVLRRGGDLQPTPHSHPIHRSNTPNTKP